MPPVLETLSTLEQRASQLAEAQAAELLERVPQSLALGRRAARSLAGGATSAWQPSWPCVLWLAAGAGATVYDVDGNEYVDLHGGFGATIAGHGHPALVAALQQRVARGTHLAQPTRDAVVVAEILAERFGLPLWRFCNSGTEATMDAVHLMRAFTGRPLVVKAEGHYHGHHDALHHSVAPSLHDAGEARSPGVVPDAPGLSPGARDDLVIVPYNDLDALKTALLRHEGRVAGMILEPIAMNPVPIPPRDGYLEGVRALLHAHGALLAFDEVQTGLVVHPGGATALYGVLPDLVCVAKALGGGFPVAAIGGSEQVMRLVADGVYRQVGTFNGNPLAMAAGRTMLLEVLTPDAYHALGEWGAYIVERSNELLRERHVPARAVGVGPKGCVIFADEPPVDYRTSLAASFTLARSHYAYQLNHGVLLPPWGKWLLGVCHDRPPIDAFLTNLGGFLAELA